jgi:cyclase
MLKKRLIGVVVVKDGLAVQSLGFRRYLPVGKPEIVVSFLDRWGIDEIAVIDITATLGQRLDTKLVACVSRACQVPITFGGGIRTADDMTRVVQAGADKVLVNHAFLERPEVVGEGAGKLGAQCVLVSIDAIRAHAAREPAVYDYVTKKALGRSVLRAAKDAEAAGAGEIFLNSVDRDGSKAGYDLELAAEVSSSVRIPVILCGGVGHAAHFAPAFKIPNVSGVAAGNYWNFTEHSVTVAKQFLSRSGELLRHDTYFDYSESPLTEDVRLGRKDDKTLTEMLFEFHLPEIL